MGTIEFVRWLLLLPAALLCGMIGSLSGGFAVGMLGQAAADTGSAFVGPFAFILAASLIAPRLGRGVAAAASILVGLLAILTVFLSRFSALPEFTTLAAHQKTAVPLAQLMAAVSAFVLVSALHERAGKSDPARKHA